MRASAPLSLDEFQTRLLDVSQNLPRRLKQCADFVARNPDRIAVSTVAELSAAAGVQPSAFMRFCKLMGFSGFSQMQRMFRDTHAQRWPDYGTRLENLRAGGADTPSALLAEFVDAGRVSLEKLTNTVTPAQLEGAVTVLAGARMIHVIGLRRVFPVAAYLAYAFEKMNIPALLHDHVGNLGQRHAILEGDVLLAITFAPYSEETVDLVSYARDRNVEVVALTDAMNSPLHQMGATTLIVSELDVGAFRALSATFSLALALAVAVGTQREG